MGAQTENRPVHIDSVDEFDMLLASEELVLADFYTDNCAMCGALEPVLGNVARVTETTIALVDSADLFDLTSRYQIKSVPSLLLFQDGTEADRLAQGFVGADRVLEFLSESDP
jgi:thioredoxin-like negative regulator of GroEL